MNWIKERREALHLTQEQLTARIQANGYNITRATLSHWEMGRTHPQLNDPLCANALATALRMSTSAILRAGGYHVQELNEKAKRAAEIVNRMPPRKQDTALVILEELLKEDVV